MERRRNKQLITVSGTELLRVHQYRQIREKNTWRSL